MELRAQYRTVYFYRQHSTTWRSDRKRWGLELGTELSIPPVNTVSHGGQIKRSGAVQNCLFHQSVQYHMVVRSSCIPPVSTVSHGGQIIVHSTSQYSITWWSDHRAFHQSIQYHMVVRSSCIPPVNTVSHGGQIIVHSTSQYSITWWSDHRAFHQSI